MVGAGASSGRGLYKIEKRMTIDIGCRPVQTLNK